MYMPFAGPQYIRELKGGRMDALASRICSMNEVLHLPPWMNGWMVSEAGRCGIDAAVMLVPPDNRLSQSGTQLTQHALEAAAFRCWMSADMVDAKDWNHDRMVEQRGRVPAREGIAYEACSPRSLPCWRALRRRRAACPRRRSRCSRTHRHTAPRIRSAARISRG